MNTFYIYACHSGESATLFPFPVATVYGESPPNVLSIELVRMYYRTISTPSNETVSEHARKEHEEKMAKADAITDIQELIELIYETEMVAMDTFSVVDFEVAEVEKMQIAGEMIFESMQDDTTAYQGTAVWFNILSAQEVTSIEVPLPAELQD